MISTALMLQPDRRAALQLSLQNQTGKTEIRTSSTQAYKQIESVVEFPGGKAPAAVAEPCHLDAVAEPCQLDSG